MRTGINIYYIVEIWKQVIFRRSGGRSLQGFGAETQPPEDSGDLEPPEL